MIPKFRFWYEREDYYPDENYMRHVWGIEYIADNKIELNDDYILNPYTNVAENIYAKTKIYLMRSTGLKDMNGAEIYEGDICWDAHNNCYGEVIFDEGKFRYVWLNICEDLWEVTDVIEIIGNIYENPELLEVEE